MSDAERRARESYRIAGDTPAPVDWPARFRKAADVVAAHSPHLPVTAQHFDDIADRLESGLLPPHVVEAIGRALTGETK